MTNEVIFLQEDALNLSVPDNYVDLVVTSPPYFGIETARYGGNPKAQINSDKDAKKMLSLLVKSAKECERVLKSTGCLWINIGAVRNKSLPYEFVHLVLKHTNLKFLGEIYWDYSKPGEREERLSANHGLWLHFVNDTHNMYFNPFTVKRYSSGAWVLPGNNESSLIDQKLLKEGFAYDTFPEEIPKRLIEMFTKPGHVVLDPFGGTGVAAVTAYKMGRVGITNDISADQVKLAKRRLELVKESK